MNAITKEMLADFRLAYSQNRHAHALNAAAAKSDLDAIAFVSSEAAKLNGEFSIEIKTHGITAQLRSGRCWMFSGMNFIRERVLDKCGMESFELSGNYLAFYDKLEKANNVLEMTIATAEEAPTSPAFKYIFESCLGDGGDWDMFIDLVKKYGVVPKEVMPDTYLSSHTEKFLLQFNRLLRKDAAELRRMIAAGQDPTERKVEMMAEIYNMLCIVFGQPVETFDFTYRDQDKEYHADYDLTPAAFFKKYIDVDFDEYVNINSMPTYTKEFGKKYTFHYRGNMAEGNITCLNVDVDTMENLVLEQLKNGETVMFSNDSRHYGDRALGIWDQNSFDYQGVLGGLDLSMSREDELVYLEADATHCMLLTGVNLDKNGRPNRWKIENSWGAEAGKNGYFVCSEDYFRQYVYQAIIHKKYLPEELMTIWNGEAITLKPWEA